MKRRDFLAGTAALGSLLATSCLSACTRSPLVFGIHPWIGYGTLHLAREFNELPHNVQFQQGKSVSDSLAALRAGSIDAACLTLDEFLLARAAGLPLSVALVFDLSAGVDVVLGRETIVNLSDLAGKRIAYEPNAVGGLVFSKFLETAGVPVSAVQAVHLSPDRQLEAWRRNELDVVVSYDPAASLIQREGARRLFDSRQMPDTIFDVLAVRMDRMQHHSAGLKALIASHFFGLHHLQVNVQDAQYRLAAYLGMKIEEIRQTLAGIVFPSLAANHEYLASGGIRLQRAAKSLSSLMLRQGLLKQPVSLDDLTTSAYLPRV